MAIVKIPNQAVALLKPSETSHNENDGKCQAHVDYCQLVQCDDESNVQIDTTEQTGTELIQNGDFGSSTGWTFGTGWAYDGVGLKADHTGAAVGVLTQTALQTGRFYRIQYEIVVNDDTANFRVLTGDAISGCDLSASSLPTTLGTYQLFAFSCGTIIKFQSTNTLSLDNISVKQLSTVSFAVINCETDEIITVDANQDLVLNVTDFFNDPDDVADTSTFEIQIDWSDAISSYTCDEGCYKLLVWQTEQDNISTDGDDGFFEENITGFSVVTNCTLAHEVSTGGVPSSFVKPLRPLIQVPATGVGIGGALKSTVTAAAVAAFENDNALNITVGEKYILYGWVYVDANADTGTDIVLASSPVDFTFDLIQFKIWDEQTDGFDVWVLEWAVIEVTAITGATPRVRRSIQNSAAGGEFYFDNFKIFPISSPCLESECFFLKDTHPCTVKLTGTNTENAFGLNYKDFGFVQNIRLEAELDSPRYPESLEQNRSSKGTTDNKFFDSQKIQQLRISHQPEYVHDFLRLWKGNDTITIDATEYVATPGDYEPEWPQAGQQTVDVGKVTIDVQKKTDFNQNRNC